MSVSYIKNNTPVKSPVKKASKDLVRLATAIGVISGEERFLKECVNNMFLSSVTTNRLYNVDYAIANAIESMTTILENNNG